MISDIVHNCTYVHSYVLSKICLEASQHEQYWTFTAIDDILGKLREEWDVWIALVLNGQTNNKLINLVMLLSYQLLFIVQMYTTEM